MPYRSDLVWHSMTICLFHSVHMIFIGVIRCRMNDMWDLYFFLSLSFRKLLKKVIINLIHFICFHAFKAHHCKLFRITILLLLLLFSKICIILCFVEKETLMLRCFRKDIKLFEVCHHDNMIAIFVSGKSSQQLTCFLTEKNGLSEKSSVAVYKGAWHNCVIRDGNYVYFFDDAS